MIEHSSWVLPVAQELYKNRKQLQSLWKSIETYMFGTKHSIAVTGLGGAGKTVLQDHLSGKAFSAKYTPPGASDRIEHARVPGENIRLDLTAIPGQTTMPSRLDGLAQAFQTKQAVDGVIHVVSGGFVSHSPAVKENSIRLGIDTIQKFVSDQIKAELDALDEVCDLVRASIRMHGKPRWIVIAVTKCDLYYNNIEAYRDYYYASKDSTFVARINKLQNQVGSDNLTWIAAPVCSWLEDFEWNGQVVNSVLNTAQRNH